MLYYYHFWLLVLIVVGGVLIRLTTVLNMEKITPVNVLCQALVNQVLLISIRCVSAVPLDCVQQYHIMSI